MFATKYSKKQQVIYPHDYFFYPIDDLQAILSNCFSVRPSGRFTNHLSILDGAGGLVSTPADLVKLFAFIDKVELAKRNRFELHSKASY